MNATPFLKSLLGKSGFVLLRKHHAAARYAEELPAGLFDDLLLRLFPALEGLRFVQIGANDGVRADPIRRHVLRHRWRGLLVEPQPELFAELRRNYANQPQLQFLNAAVDLQRGERPIYFLRPDLPDLPDWAWGLGSFDRARLRSAASELGLEEDAIATQTIATVTWAEILAAFGPGPCDLLVIDAEGYDLPLLRAAPFANWRPRMIHFEHVASDRADRLAVYGELIGLGYEIASCAGDTIAWLREKAPAAHQ